jgi:uncharacterized protein YceH (UPF0502 family)
MTLRALTPLEARVLGVLVEKQHTVPDSYPLSLNTLTLGCNQKTARDPVINASEADVLGAVDGLRALSLVFEGSGSRVVRYEHNMGRVLGVPSQSVALLTTLLLRGPQTAAELRSNCDRLHRFADVSSVEAFLDELSSKDPVRVVKLPRAPGAREARWAHLLCGEAALPAPSSEGDLAARPEDAVSLGELAAMKAELTRMAAELEAVKGDLHSLKSALGLAPT